MRELCRSLAVVLAYTWCVVGAGALAARSGSHDQGAVERARRLAAVAAVEESMELRGWMNHVRSFQQHLVQDVAKDALAVTPEATHSFEPRWFSQRLDHFNRQNDGLFWQRYFVFREFYGGPGSPVFFYCGGEQGDIAEEWNRYGFTLEVANRSRALVIYAEHRFFGQSMPFGDTEAAFEKDARRLGLLSVEQSLEDYAAILRRYKADGPVLTFGGSLSGSLAALMRVRHPALVDMAYASSAPVMGYPGLADQFSFRRLITENWAREGGEDCVKLVRKGFAAVASPDPASLAQAFPACEGDAPPTEGDWQRLYWAGWGSLEYLGSNTYHPHATAGIAAACDRMRTSSPEDRRDSSSESLGDGAIFKALLFPAWGLPLTRREAENETLPSGARCTNFTRLRAEAAPQAGYAGVGHGWAYMACTEVIHPIGANNKTDFFPAYDWNVHSLAAGCRQAWGVTPRAAFLPEAFGFPVPLDDDDGDEVPQAFGWSESAAAPAAQDLVTAAASPPPMPPSDNDAKESGGDSPHHRNPIGKRLIGVPKHHRTTTAGLQLEEGFLQLRGARGPTTKEEEAPAVVAPRHLRISDSIPGRIIFTYGSADPWSTMGVTEAWRDDVLVLPILGGSHCSDLQTPDAKDTEDMRQKRAGVDATITAWITEWQSKKAKELRAFGGASWPRPGPPLEPVNATKREGSNAAASRPAKEAPSGLKVASSASESDAAPAAAVITKVYG